MLKSLYLSLSVELFDVSLLLIVYYIVSTIFTVMLWSFNLGTIVHMTFFCFLLPIKPT